MLARLCSIICWFIQDAAKVGTYALLKKFNIFDINGTKAAAKMRARL